MNSTEQAHWLAEPLQLTSLPAAVVAAACIALGCLWLVKRSLEADDWGDLPGPPSSALGWLRLMSGQVGWPPGARWSGGRRAQSARGWRWRGCRRRRRLTVVARPIPPLSASPPFSRLQPLWQPQVHRFFQDATQRYSARGLWRFRLAHLRIAVVTAPDLAQALLRGDSDLPKPAILYDGVDEVSSAHWNARLAHRAARRLAGQRLVRCSVQAQRAPAGGGAARTGRSGAQACLLHSSRLPADVQPQRPALLFQHP